MSSDDDECPICYIKYGRQEDGSFICQDGAINSGEEGYCDHWVCTRCAQTMHNNLRKKDDEDASECCPICRCDWTLWLLTHYDDEEEEEEEEEEQEITPDTIVTGVNCNKCKNTVPPHTVAEHLDASHKIHICPHIH